MVSLCHNELSLKSFENSFCCIFAYVTILWSHASSAWSTFCSCCHYAVYTVRCCYNVAQFSSKSPQQTPHSSPVRVRYGVSFVSFKIWFVFSCCHCILLLRPEYFRKPAQYYGCWCPGCLHFQIIGSYDIGCEGQMYPCLLWRGISTTCTISILRNNRNANEGLNVFSNIDFRTCRFNSGLNYLK